MIHPMFAKQARWIDVLLNRFAEDPNVAAVGPSIACQPQAPHLQTYVVAMDPRGLRVANETWFCPAQNVRSNFGHRMEWIFKTEIAFSSNLIDKGYTFLSTLAATYHWDGATLYRDPSTCIYPSLHSYNGWYPTPYDFLFFKSSGYVLTYKYVPWDMWKALQVATAASLRDAESRHLGPTSPSMRFPDDPYHLQTRAK